MTFQQSVPKSQQLSLPDPIVPFTALLPVGPLSRSDLPVDYHGDRVLIRIQSTRFGEVSEKFRVAGTRKKGQGLGGPRGRAWGLIARQLIGAVHIFAVNTLLNTPKLAEQDGTDGEREYEQVRLGNLAFADRSLHASGTHVRNITKCSETASTTTFLEFQLSHQHKQGAKGALL
eukprot:gene30598-35609_t